MMATVRVAMRARMEFVLMLNGAGARKLCTKSKMAELCAPNRDDIDELTAGGWLVCTM